MAKKTKAQASETAVVDVPAEEHAEDAAKVEGKKTRRASSSAGKAQVFKGEELGELLLPSAVFPSSSLICSSRLTTTTAATRTPVTVAKELSRLNWKMNTPLSTIEGENINIPLTNPPLKAVKIYFSTGINVTARNLSNGVTIKDALKAIHKMFHKKVSTGTCFVMEEPC